MHHASAGKMQAQKDQAVTGLTKGIEGLLKKNKVRWAWHGLPRARAESTCPGGGHVNGHATWIPLYYWDTWARGGAGCHHDSVV